MAAPLALALVPALKAFGVFLAGMLARLLGSWLLMAVAGFALEILPRLFGAGQGLLSWVFGVSASAAFSAFQLSLSMAGVELPSFSELLSGLPPGILWVCSALRVHKVVFILVSIPIVKLFRKVLENVAAAGAKGSAAALAAGGKR